MSLPVPTTAGIADNIVSQLESSLSQTIPLMPKSFTRVLAKVMAGVFILLWKYAGTIFLNMFVRTASMDETAINGKTLRPLVEWGRLFGVSDPADATQAEHTVAVTVKNQVGSLAGGSQLLHAPTGVLYLTTAAVPLDAPTVTVTVIASSDQSGGDGSGTIGNLDTDAELSFANPLPNVATVAVVIARTVDGADAETAEDYRTRVIQRCQNKPQGGAYADYQQWAEEPASIVAAYPYTSSTPGEVDVYVECAATIDPDGIAGPTEIDEAAAAIELDVDGLASRRPATAAVNVYAITRTDFGVTVTGLTPDTSDNRIAVHAAVDEHLRSLEPFIVGLSVLPRRDRVSRPAISGVVNDAVSAVGAVIDLVQLFEGVDEIQGRPLGDGEKAKCEVVSWL